MNSINHFYTNKIMSMQYWRYGFRYLYIYIYINKTQLLCVCVFVCLSGLY